MAACPFDLTFVMPRYGQEYPDLTTDVIGKYPKGVFIQYPIPQKLSGCGKRVARFFGTLFAPSSSAQPPVLAMPTTTSTSTACATPSAYRLEHQRDVINRLKRIEGQVRGLIDMIESGRSCEDVAQQMSASRKAMEKTFYRMMACTVMEAVSASESEEDTLREVERSTRILEKYA